VGQFRKFVDATKFETDAERGSPDGPERKRGAFAMRERIGDRQWSADATWRNPFPNLKDFPPRDEHPVVQVSWEDAQAFCRHFGFRLPTEAEWEYACRAESTTRFPWGDDLKGGEGHANVGDMSAEKRFQQVPAAFPFDDGHAVVAPVGSYKHNAWGLYDMIGNVEEWCQDALATYPADGADEAALPRSKGDGGATRGGSFVGNAVTSRSSSRTGQFATGRRDFVGFRVAFSVSR
jgi:formylglycine-generating enzyme required for sulfatase activity